MAVTTVIIAVSGERVSEYVEHNAFLDQNDYRSSVHGIADFLDGLVDVGLIPSWSGCIYTAASGINLTTLGGTGATRYPFGR